MFIKNVHVSLCSINLCLENGPGKKCIWKCIWQITKYGGSNTNTNTNTWFEIWSNTNTNTNTLYLYLYLYLQIQIRIWPQPWAPARSTPRRQGDGSHSLHRCVQFGLGSPVRLTLDTGTVVSISTIVPHKRSGDAGCHLCCERLPTSSEVPRGETDVRQRSDGGVHQERGGHEIAHFDADDHSAAQVVRQQGDYVGSRPSAWSTQYPGGFPVQSRPDSAHGVDDDHGESTTSVCQVGRTTDRYVCDIRQQTTRQVRFTISGPQGGVDRCHVHALGQGEGTSCTSSRHSRWSRKFCRRSLNHQNCWWYWSLYCNRQHHGFQSWWT